jgi:hypothetical protein
MPQQDVRHHSLTGGAAVQGLQRAIAAGAQEVAIFAAASETFSQRNINCSIAESLKRFEEVVAAAKEGQVAVRGYVSCAVGCPYEVRILLCRIDEELKKLLVGLFCRCPAYCSLEPRRLPKHVGLYAGACGAHSGCRCGGQAVWAWLL